MHDSERALPPNHNRVPLITVATVFSFFGTLIVFLRLYIRKYILRSVGWDDHAILAAWISFVCFTIASAIGIQNGTGLFTSQVTPIDLIRVFKASFAIELTYYSTIYLIKASILLCFLRLSTALKDKLYIPTTIVLIVVSSQFVVSVIVVLVQCNPRSFYWDKSQPGTCINFEIFYYYTNIFTIISDIVIIILPIPFLSKVNRTLPQKISLIGVFAIALLSTIASCIRLYTISIFTSLDDPAYGAAPINLWSFIEINFGLACACGPALKGLISRVGKPQATPNISDNLTISVDGHPIREIPQDMSVHKSDCV